MGGRGEGCGTPHCQQIRVTFDLLENSGNYMNSAHSIGENKGGIQM